MRKYQWESASQQGRTSSQRMICLIVDASVSTSFTTMSYKWSARMVLSQVLVPKFRNPDQCYSKEIKFTLRLSIAFIFPAFHKGKKNGVCLEFKSLTVTLKCSTSNTLCNYRGKRKYGDPHTALD